MKRKTMKTLFYTTLLAVAMIFILGVDVKAKDMFYCTDYYLEEYEGESSEVKIPDNVKIICELSFYECDTVTSVIIPDSVTTIRANAFYKCPNLVHVEIPPSVKKIEKKAFRQCGADLVIACEKDSVAHTYAVENGFGCEFVDFDSRIKEQKITAYDRTIDYGTKSFNLEAKASGGGKLTYKVADKKVVTVSKSGKVTVKACGKTKITIKAAAKGNYLAATKTVTVTIRPKKQTIQSLVSTKTGKFTVKWKKDKKADGYIVEYSRTPNFDYNIKGSIKEVVVSKKSTGSCTISGLKKGKKYYVRVRSYKNSAGVKVKGRWSKIKMIKVAK